MTFAAAVLAIFGTTVACSGSETDRGRTFDTAPAETVQATPKVSTVNNLRAWRIANPGRLA